MDSGKRPAAPAQHPEFTPPGQLPGQDPGDGNGLRWTVLLLGVVLLLGLLVVFVLPGLVDRQAAGPLPSAPAGAVQGHVSAPVDASDDARAVAEQSLQAYLELRARLELDNVSAWGEPEWGRSAALADDGDRQFSQRRFRPAADAYGEALGLLQALASGMEQRFETAMAEGVRALDADDSDTAIDRFELALAIREDAAALQGLERARRRPDVLGFMRLGEQAEGSGDLAAARTAFTQAVELDSEYPPAAAALQRVSTRLADIGYRDAMTRALAALDSGRLTEAGRALQEASGYKPDDVAVGDAQRRLAAARQQSRLAGLRRQADERVHAEDWQGAVSVYRQALKVDPNAGFATDGLALAQSRARLHEQIDHYLGKPSRLYSDEPLANAGQLLEAAAGAPGDEPVLAGKIARLRRLVTEAATPLPVSLRSDGETEVVIYHVGRLGQFDSHSMQLRPGDYTVVGSRRGYRDVRKTLSVRPGKPGPVLVIRCEEPV
jgi:tetratricopeptide (TPR) repeat protein